MSLLDPTTAVAVPAFFAGMLAPWIFTGDKKPRKKIIIYFSIALVLLAAIEFPAPDWGVILLYWTSFFLLVGFFKLLLFLRKLDEERLK